MDQATAPGEEAVRRLLRRLRLLALLLGALAGLAYAVAICGAGGAR